MTRRSRRTSLPRPTTSHSSPVRLARDVILATRGRHLQSYLKLPSEPLAPSDILRNAEQPEHLMGLPETCRRRFLVALSVVNSGQVQFCPCHFKPCTHRAERLEGLVEVPRRFGVETQGVGDPAQRSLGPPESKAIRCIAGHLRSLLREVSCFFDLPARDVRVAQERREPAARVAGSEFPQLLDRPLQQRNRFRRVSLLEIRKSQSTRS